MQTSKGLYGKSGSPPTILLTENQNATFCEHSIGLHGQASCRSVVGKGSSKTKDYRWLNTPVFRKPISSQRGQIP